MVCVNIEIVRKLIVRKKKKNAGIEPYTVTIVGAGKSIDFYILPLLPLACTCILVYTGIVYYIWSYIVIWIIWLNVFLLCDIKVTNVQWYGL